MLLLSSEFLQDFVDLIRERYPDLLRATGQHLILSAVALALGVLVAVPIGMLLAHHPVKWARSGVFGVANIFQTIPSLALLALLIPLFGIGTTPAILALFLYSLMPILRNTYTGFRSVDPAILESARGMGYGAAQRLMRIQFPLAFPYIMSGIRVTTVYIISWATLATLIGAGGLGQLIVSGIGVNKEELVVAGAAAAIILALLADGLLGGIERRVARRAHPKAASK